MNPFVAPPRSTIQADFDRIAPLAVASPGWNHSRHYYGFLLRNLPPYCSQTLEIGCGAGDFARRLAGRSGRVLALDLSPRSVRWGRAE